MEYQLGLIRALDCVQSIDSHSVAHRPRSLAALTIPQIAEAARVGHSRPQGGEVGGRMYVARIDAARAD